jgi:plasmid stabilization system protein ParE
MKYRVLIRPEAEIDLKYAFSWYEDKRPGLGHDFLLQIEAGLRYIERNPESNPPEYKGARKYLVKKFPYKIIYLAEEAGIVILAVIHGKRNPELIKNRMNPI